MARTIRRIRWAFRKAQRMPQSTALLLAGLIYAGLGFLIVLVLIELS